MEILVAVGLVILGLALLAGGGETLVRLAVSIATLAGVTPAVIGLTVVAVGTSLPELAVSVIAARAGQPDIAVGNMIGSNIFNTLGILGTTALILSVPISPTVVTHDMWWMIGTALLLFPIMRSGLKINRLEGGVLFGIYVVYVTLLLRAG